MVIPGSPGGGKERDGALWGVPTSRHQGAGFPGVPQGDSPERAAEMPCVRQEEAAAFISNSLSSAVEGDSQESPAGRQHDLPRPDQPPAKKLGSGRWNVLC